MRDIEEVRKVDKDENWMNGLFAKLLYIFHLFQFICVLVRREGKRISFQMFFNNETSMRHRLKLLGIYVY